MTTTSPSQVESKDFSITETYVEFNQEPVREQRFTKDVDYDDTTIGPDAL